VCFLSSLAVTAASSRRILALSSSRVDVMREAEAADLESGRGVERCCYAERS
jgi:hypothetical protein